MVIWLSVFVLYFIFLLLLIAGLLRWRKRKSVSVVTPPVSIVVAMRNEMLNLQTLIASLTNQNYLGKWELILVDDHSEDDSVQVAQILKHQYSKLIINVLSSTGTGKKQALNTGIENAVGEIILTTDADCELPNDWITDLVNSFEEKTQLVVGAVRLKPESTLLSNLQAVEFASIMATGLGMLGWGKPLMCNGASLAYRKLAFLQVGGYAGNEHIPSGDDEFLMRKIADKFPVSIKAVNYGNNTCQTKPATSMAEFFDQRIRWAGKWQANTSWLAKLIAVFVFLFQVIWLPVVAIALFTPSPLLLAGVLIKILLECILIVITSKAIQQPFSLLAFLALQVLYPPYVMVVALASLLVGYRWKGRTVLAPR
jgi:glycosyltransferase involved in cell wall biosynthesis